MLALAEARAVSQYSGFGTGSSMPLSSQEIFPVVSNFKQLSLSPAHDHPLQPEDMVTDKEPVQQPEVRYNLESIILLVLVCLHVHHETT